MARIFGKLAIGGTAALAALLFAVPALAYSVGSGSFATAPATVTPGVPFTFSVTFIQPDGTPFPAGVPVVFSFSFTTPGTVTLTGSASGAGNSGSVSATVTVVAGTGAVTTGAAGVHLVAAVIPSQACDVSFDPASSSTDATGTASTQVTVSAGCAAAASAAAPSAALPNTGAYPGTSGDSWMGPAGFGGGAALLIVLVGFMYWRQRRNARNNEA